ncbi:Gfo/Idh/MocA family protein [Dyadobacter fanqingshengii]|uniref:Gfo/Idh/MocA family oxidoreductase n=1 Tax=Dyadobacter fanqingshengii TaxID=2906443 RepID=A0A9X1P6W5_9BACT|nr:Gfo/Idh/MocA family oxidoreductase [Dyadobacter fanqingshengii]MCF0039446.1 Gfo/Idh/MocA family oxidoreductase [Dyadobacter fanqingshengii]USJ33743.1 Gfo/Idh/MocA family oxidoreductase [Dyadobacter fanqingshengii]
MEINTLNRRDFLKAGAVISSFMIVPRHVLGKGYLAPSDKIALGFIGCGRQSGGLRNRFLDTMETQIVAASDVYAVKRESFVTNVNKWYAEKAAQSNYKSAVGIEDFRELLSRKDIDAVIIAAPDHWHASMAVRAAEAGKDIYCEKPLSLTVKEGRAMVDATRKHNRVFQTGSMQRSSKEFTQAAQLVRSGAIGTVKQVFVNVGGPPKVWDLKEETKPDGLNWDLWMGPNAMSRPYNNELAPAMNATFWPKWRDYIEFGGGGMTDWGAHMFDIAQWGLGMDDSGPVELIYSEPTKGLVYKYANRVEVIHRPMEGKQHCHFVGSDGEVFVARGELRTTPETLKDKVFNQDDYKVYVSDNHYKDFLNAIRTRKPPICDVEVGHRTASICNLGNIAYRLQRSLKWNPKKEEFKKDKEANQLLGRDMKAEWKV